MLFEQIVLEHCRMLTSSVNKTVKKNYQRTFKKSGGTFGKQAVLKRSSKFTKSTDNDSLEINFKIKLIKSTDNDSLETKLKDKIYKPNLLLNNGKKLGKNRGVF